MVLKKDYSSKPDSVKDIESRGLDMIIKKLQAKIKNLKVENNILDENNQKLEKRVESLEGTVELSSYDSRTLKSIYLKSITPRRNTTSEECNKCRDEIRKTLSLKESLYRRLAFCSNMNTLLRLGKDFKKIPFFYYDLMNQEIVATPSAFRLFRIDEPVDGRIKLFDLIRDYVHKDYRRGLLEAFFKGESLGEYYFISKGDTPKKLVLDAYPLLYETKDNKNPVENVGMGVFIRDPLNEDYDKRTALRFAGHFERIVKELGKDFKIIRYKH